MTVKKPLSMLVAASLLAWALPARAASEPGGNAKAPSASSLTRSIDRTAVRMGAETPRAHSRANARENENLEMQGGGGGGHAGMVVLMLVSTAASIGGGYYLYKQMKKQTDSIKP